MFQALDAMSGAFFVRSIIHVATTIAAWPAAAGHGCLACSRRTFLPSAEPGAGGCAGGRAEHRRRGGAVRRWACGDAADYVYRHDLGIGGVAPHRPGAGRKERRRVPHWGYWLRRRRGLLLRLPAAVC